jgi:ABC-type antimicrobial peptide transport system permease subunit
MVLGETALLIATGLALGMLLALAATRFVAGFLYGLPPNDPVTLIAAALMLSGVALAAGYMPARRASRLEPMSALRDE